MRDCIVYRVEMQIFLTSGRPTMNCRWETIFITRYLWLARLRVLAYNLKRHLRVRGDARILPMLALCER